MVFGQSLKRHFLFIDCESTSPTPPLKYLSTPNKFYISTTFNADIPSVDWLKWYFTLFLFLPILRGIILKRLTLIPATLMTLSLSFSTHAFDYQSVINKGVQGAVTGAIEGKSGKEILKDTKTTTGQEAQQQVQQQAAEMAKTAPTADTNPMGAIATDIAAQKAAEKAGGGASGQMASDLVKGLSGAAQQKLMGQPAAPVAEAAPVATPAAVATPAKTKKTTKKKAPAKKKPAVKK